jgi:hypothetical protein
MIDRIRELEPVWIDELAEQAETVARERAKAERLLARAEARALEIERVRRWIDRNAHGHEVMQIAFADLPAPAPVPTPTLDPSHAGVIHAA